MHYIYKNPYVKNSTPQRSSTKVNIEKPKYNEPYEYHNPYTLKKVDAVPIEETIADTSKNHEQDKIVSTVLPELLVKQIDALDLSRIMRDKALKLVSILYMKGMYNGHDLSKYVPLAAHYLEKTFNKEYHKDFFNRLKAAGIIQCNEEYQQGSMFKKGKAKGYRINGGLLNSSYIPVFYEDRKQKNTGKDGGLRKAEIFINRTYFYKDSNILPDNSINNSCSSDTNQISSNTCLSIHISSRLFQKSLIIDDLSSLEYDQDRIWKATKEHIAYISSRLFVDDEILRNSFEVTNCLLDNFTYHTTKEKAMIWAKEHDANVIQDGRHFYIQKLKQYVKAKKLNVYWKTYNDKWGYTVSFPKNITDGGTTASGIHYYNGNDVADIAVESDCVDKTAKLKDELKQWYNSVLKNISPTYYDVVTKELTDNSFVIIKKDKDGSGISYEKCIMGTRCLFKLSFSVDYHNLKKLNDKDAEMILHLFTTTK